MMRPTRLHDGYLAVASRGTDGIGTMETTRGMRALVFVLYELPLCIAASAPASACERNHQEAGRWDRWMIPTSGELSELDDCAWLLPSSYITPYVTCAPRHFLSHRPHRYLRAHMTHILVRVHYSPNNNNNNQLLPTLLSSFPKLATHSPDPAPTSSPTA